MPSPAPLASEGTTARLVAIGQHIRAHRKTLGVSATAAAEAAGISRVTLHRIEHGEASVTIGAWLNALESLGLQLEVVLRCEPKLPFSIATKRVQARADALPRTIHPAKYPQLHKLAWQLRPTTRLTHAEALGLYERNWRHLDREQMLPHERVLIAKLTRTLGRGHLLV